MASFGQTARDTRSVAFVNLRRASLTDRLTDLQALILNDVSSIQLDTLRRIVGLAKQGLPVILVGKTPMESAGLRLGADGRVGTDDIRIQALLADMKKMERCTRVRDIGEVPKVLKTLHVP